jgi:hypothetical protein
MRRLLLFVLFLIFSFKGLKAQEKIQLSEYAQISVITMGPSLEELYAAFGHNAIRVFDPVNKIDYAYNYGTFDFDQPNFYLNFARGSLLYKLSVQDYQRLKDYYIYYKRFIHEQVVDINQDQKQVVFDYLQNNALPENADYYYDYFYDNCATRIRDVFVETLGYAVRFESSHITQEKSIRQLTDEYLLDHHPWGDLGIDFCLGLPMDKVLSPIEYMFLPDYVEAGFKNAWIKTAGGEKPLVRPASIVYEPTELTEPKTIFTPTVVFLLVLIAGIAITRYHMKGGIRGRYFDLGLFLLVGLLGVFLTLLWFTTDHKAAAGNLNLIWAFPFHLIAAIILLRKRLTPFWKKYYRYTTLIMALLLITWPLLPQSLHTSLIFICALLGIRAAYIGWGGAYAQKSSASE